MLVAGKNTLHVNYSGHMFLFLTNKCCLVNTGSTKKAQLLHGITKYWHILPCYEIVEILRSTCMYEAIAVTLGSSLGRNNVEWWANISERYVDFFRTRKSVMCGISWFFLEKSRKICCLVKIISLFSHHGQLLCSTKIFVVEYYCQCYQ